MLYHNLLSQSIKNQSRNFQFQISMFEKTQFVNAISESLCIIINLRRSKKKCDIFKKNDTLCQYSITIAKKTCELSTHINRAKLNKTMIEKKIQNDQIAKKTI